MTETDLQHGTHVIHIRTKKEYTIISARSRMMDSMFKWIDAVTYAAFPPDEYSLYTLSVHDFMKTFRLKKEQ